MQRRLLRAGLPLVLLALLCACGAEESTGAPGPGEQRPGQEPRVIGLCYVQGDGPVAVAAADLAALGAPDPARVQVRRHGQPVASWLAGGNLRFEAAGTANPHTVHAAYRFWLHGEEVAGAPPAPRAPAGTARWTRDDDRIHGALASGKAAVYQRPAPSWFLARIPRSERETLALEVTGVDARRERTLDVVVYAAHEGTVALGASLDGVDLGIAKAASAAGGATLTWKVPAREDAPAASSLRLGDISPPLPPAPARDISRDRGTVWIDAVGISGAGAPYEPPARRATVRRLDRIPDPLAAAGAARHVILATPPLLAAARRLAAHRTNTGLSSVAIPVVAVYQRYGHGDQVPGAIRAFVRDLEGREDAPLEYLLLAGDAVFDRTDRSAEPTIPVWMTRSIYNGATASDRPYVAPEDGSLAGGPSLGRLPFRAAADLDAYVDRVIRYETAPPADASRRMFRFITSEARFGVVIDALIERKFRGVLSEQIPPAYEVEVTFASARSPFLWPPPELNAKVIAGLNEGALFYTYVGHGFAAGFDTLRVDGERHRILHLEDVQRVDIKGTPPAVFVIACTTAQFDGLTDGIGEALMKQPRGPVAYFGATRICHPVYNALIGQAIASHMGTDAGGEPLRLGRVLDAARDEVVAGGTMMDIRAAAVFLAAGSKVDDLVREGVHMYTLLGDPALKLAMPRGDLAVKAKVPAGREPLDVAVAADLPDGTEVHVSLELPRDRNAAKPEQVADPGDPASFGTIRENHRRMNDWAVARATGRLAGGRLALQLDAGLDAAALEGLVVKAWCIAGDDVHQGAAILPAP